jgi:hypothetical protein
MNRPKINWVSVTLVYEALSFLRTFMNSSPMSFNPVPAVLSSVCLQIVEISFLANSFRALQFYWQYVNLSLCLTN